MFFRRNFFFSKLIKPHQPKTTLKIDNSYQTLIDPYVFNKSVKKFTMTPPQYEGIQDDPYLKQFKIYSSKFYLDMTKYPDHYELLIDLKTFSIKDYIKYLFKTKWEDLEPKDEFVYRIIQMYLLFIIHIILREALFYYCSDESPQQQTSGATKQKMGTALSDSHYDYTRFEKEFDYSMLLFTRSIKRIKNELDID